jgi:Uma2 family endonuclease
MTTSELPTGSIEMLSEDPAFPSSPLGPYRKADYMSLPEDVRCELLYGRFYRMTPPRPLHQVVAAVLWRWLDDIAVARGGFAGISPIAITLADHSVVEPDVIYLARKATAAELKSEISGLPDLLIEVLSPTSVRRDRRLKLRLYEESGLQEYWIVDPVARQINFFQLRNGRFQPVQDTHGIYRSERLPEIELNLAELWRQVDLRQAG